MHLGHLKSVNNLWRNYFTYIIINIFQLKHTIFRLNLLNSQYQMLMFYNDQNKIWTERFFLKYHIKKQKTHSESFHSLSHRGPLQGLKNPHAGTTQKALAGLVDWGVRGRMKGWVAWWPKVHLEKEIKFFRGGLHHQVQEIKIFILSSWRPFFQI